MIILPNRYYHYEFEGSTFITKTFYHYKAIWANDVMRLSGNLCSMTNWEFERVATQPNSPLSNIFEVSPETHPEYFI